MPTRLLRTLIALALAGSALAACGNDDDGAAAPGSGGDDTAIQSDTDDNGATDDGDDGEWPPASALGTGAAGTVTIDGTTYQLDAVRECDVTDFAAGDNRDREWMVEAIGLSDPEVEWSDEVEVWVYTESLTNPVKDGQGIRYYGPEGLYDNTASGDGDLNMAWTSGTTTLDGPPLDITDDRITGELFLRSGLGNPNVDVTVDLAQPTDGPVDCDY